MSLDFEISGQVQNGSKMCGLLKNLAEKVLSTQSLCEKETHESEKNLSSPVIKDYYTDRAGEESLPNQSTPFDSNGNLYHDRLSPDKSHAPDVLETTELRKVTKETGDVENHVELPKDANTSVVSRLEKPKDAESFREFGGILKLSNILCSFVSSENASNLPYRPMAEMLISIGTDAAMLHICKDIIECLETTPISKMNEDVKINISKAKDAENYLTERFKPYTIPYRLCKCGRKCYTKAELAGHRMVGWSTSSAWFRCCFCSTFKTRAATQFVDHLCDVHGVRGTTEPSLKHMCNYCPYENRDWRRTMMHEDKCKSRFILSRNLFLVNNDIIIFGRPALTCMTPSKTSFSKISSTFGCSTPQSIPIQNHFNQLQQTSACRSQVRVSLANNPSDSSRPVHSTVPKSNLLNEISRSAPLTMQQIQDAALAMAQAQMHFSVGPQAVGGTRSQGHVDIQPKVQGGGPSCEICDASVTTLESLLKHMQQFHQINIKSIDFFLKGKAFVCKTCFQGFWTQLGLGRHQQQVHSKQVYPCFICGPIASTDILTHLLVKHNISLQDMLTFGWCYICKAETKTSDIFVNHMVTIHPDLFPSKSALESIVILFRSVKDNVRTPRTSLQTMPAPLKPSTSKAKSSTSTITSQILPGRTKHRCNPCQIRFENEFELQAHYRAFHTVSCTRCKEKWTSVEAMLKHFNQRHYAEKDHCILCKEQVKIGVPMIRHMKRMHLKKCVVVMKRLSPSQRMKYLQLSKRSTKSNMSALHSFSFVQPQVVIKNCKLVSN